MPSRQTEQRDKLAPSHFELEARPFLLWPSENRDVERKLMSAAGLELSAPLRAG